MLTNLTVSQFMTFGTTADEFLNVNFFRCAMSAKNDLDEIIINSGLSESAVVRGSVNESVNIEMSLKPFAPNEINDLDEIAINSGLSESAVVRGSVNESVNIEMSLKPFAPNEIVRFQANFHTDEYTTLNEPVSGRFIIHDNRELAVIGEKSYRIEPGKYYIFYITKLTDELLPLPYPTDCRYYSFDKSIDENNTDYDQFDSMFIKSPTSKSNCIIGCIAKKTVQTCKCWPPELPYLYIGLEINNTKANLSWCNWRERPPIDSGIEKPTHLTWFQYCFNVHESECNKWCKSDCSINRFQISKEEIEWPSRERIERSEDGEELRGLRQCCALISIRYWTAEQKINKYKPRFELAEFTSYVGGLLSMWLGFSLFGFYGLSEQSIVRFVNYCIKKRARKRNAKISNNGSSPPNRKVSGKLSSEKVFDDKRKEKSRERISSYTRPIEKWERNY
ncbi:hypothetical protein RDWZM_005308 [Blomia tropicalis]|uniref:Uncharacterized protein n=1 Tax=Blomia tropicalis TaxID=40697 RepID=A0A9Q0M547_BLOTA|nr:hypothetical protein RDWZM_005308 [Blomia tropicalis]